MAPTFERQLGVGGGGGRIYRPIVWSGIGLETKNLEESDSLTFYQLKL